MLACLLVFLSLTCISAADLLNFGWSNFDLSPNHLFKRAVQPAPKQCALVYPPSVFQVPPVSQSGGGSSNDQSPPLPGPSEAEPGTIRAQSACGATGATGTFVSSVSVSRIVVEDLDVLETIMPLSGPNGASPWLTCGINSTGWTASFATVQDVVIVDLAFVLSEGNSPFQACNQYLDIMERYAAQFNG